jgi:hypothetical protein
MIPVFKWAETLHALDCMVTMTDNPTLLLSLQISDHLLRIELMYYVPANPVVLHGLNF